jgi:hypothetical protein
VRDAHPVAETSLAKVGDWKAVVEQLGGPRDLVAGAWPSPIMLLADDIFNGSPDMIVA